MDLFELMERKHLLDQQMLAMGLIWVGFIAFMLWRWLSPASDEEVSWEREKQEKLALLRKANEP